jgi:hypothetical protein
MLEETFVAERAHLRIFSEIWTRLSHVVLAQSFSSTQLVLSVSHQASTVPGWTFLTVEPIIAQFGSFNRNDCILRFGFYFILRSDRWRILGATLLALRIKLVEIWLWVVIHGRLWDWWWRIIRIRRIILFRSWDIICGGSLCTHIHKLAWGVCRVLLLNFLSPFWLKWHVV